MASKEGIGCNKAGRSIFLRFSVTLLPFIVDYYEALPLLLGHDICHVTKYALCNDENQVVSD